MTTAESKTQKPLVIAVVTADPGFLAQALGALSDLGEAPAFQGDLARSPSGAEPEPLYAEVTGRARRYLDRTRQSLAITVVQAASLEGAAERIASLGADAGPLSMLYVDASSSGLAAEALALEPRIEAFYARIEGAPTGSVRSPYNVVVHLRTPPWSEGTFVLPDRYLLRVVQPASPWLLRAEVLALLFDFLELTYENRRNHKAAVRESAATLGDELVRFLCDRAGSEWLFFYYTSSGVSPLIDHIERVSSQRGVLALRGANEHALACGAIASHLLHRRPFLMALGLSMMDELRGTLANMRTAGVRGFIIGPEVDPDLRYGFQATVSADEDMRAVLAARHIPCVYIERPEVLAERLEEAYRLYEEDRGPVVLLATQSVLDERSPLPRAPVFPPARPRAELTATQEDAIARAAALLNGERTKVLWQLGRLDAEERELVLSIAERAGVALVDTLGHPGTVPAYRDGRAVPHYLGTLGLYGFKQRSHAFLHPDGKLGARPEHAVFFIKSKVGQRATFFTPFRRSGLRIVQVTRKPEHVAPDAEIAAVMEARDFLRALSARLDVDPEILRFRTEAIRATTAPGADLASRLPSQPMSPNYFFRELGALFEEMIVDDGYTYTGVYDVGRCAVSSVRSVPRTGPGFSGWYGRALMGDAPASMSTLAITEPGNVVAFVGDGSRSIIADPIPALIENALAHPSRLDKNISIFYFTNGTFSGIRSYRERLASRWGGRQMRSFGLLDQEGDRTIGPLVVARRTLSAFDGPGLREALLARGRLNVFTVLLGHNNEDDGFSLVSTDGWQRGHD